MPQDIAGLEVCGRDDALVGTPPPEDVEVVRVSGSVAVFCELPVELAVLSLKRLDLELDFEAHPQMSGPSSGSGDGRD